VRLAANDLVLGIRPEHLLLTPAGDGLAARVALLEHLGDSTIVHATLRGSAHTVALRVPADHPPLSTGDDVGLAPQPGRSLLFQTDGQSVALH
jgi:multiple sugar transport system ATP-binding protein